MDQNSLVNDLESISDCSETNKIDLTPQASTRKLYFINEIVEWQLTQYIWTGCTDVKLRDEIMSHATELIRQIIRKQGLHQIYPGQDESSFGDLLQTAWVQIERTLYKYRARPHCRRCYNPDRPNDSVLYNPGVVEYGIKTIEDTITMHDGKCPKCRYALYDIPIIKPVQGLFAGTETILYRGMSKVFNMWSQVARTVILAHIKKEGRDRKNSGSYVSHLGNKQKPISGIIERFLNELREINRFDDTNLKIIEALEQIINNDEKPHDGLISKLVNQSGFSRQAVTNFLKVTKLRSFELTDSPVNRTIEPKIDNRKAALEVEEE
jgi:hypothetical protein